MYDYWLSVPLPCGQHMVRLQNTKIIMTEPTCLAMAFSINSLIWAGASKVLTISDGAIDLRFSPLIQKKQLGSSKYFTTTTLCCNWSVGAITSKMENSPIYSVTHLKVFTEFCHQFWCISQNYYNLAPKTLAKWKLKSLKLDQVLLGCLTEKT